MKKLRGSIWLILLTAFTWSAAMVLFVFFRFWNGHAIVNWQGADLIGSTSTALWLTALGGFLVGMVAELLEVYFFSQWFKRVPTPLTILVKSFAQFGFLVVYVFVLISLFDFYERVNYRSTADYLRYYFDASDMLPLLIYVFTLIFFLAVFRRLYRLVGPLNFGSVMLGRYNLPREEERIFMFLDLDSSTELAEQMGHKKVSALIQECFNDLAGISINYRAQTYQYVGDEVVLTWQKRSGFKKNRCLEVYFAFQALLQKRSRYYQSRFGFVPSFKCALHAGKVISTQVGQLKVEIAFHGDTVNTTARMLEKCHEYGESLLVSGAIYENVKADRAFAFKRYGASGLRGKAEKIELFGVAHASLGGATLSELRPA